MVGETPPRAAHVPPPSEEHLLQMWRASPVSLIRRIRTPLLLMLGTKDRRVPMGQSLQFYHGLRAMGVPTRVLQYDMDHSLGDRVEGRGNVWVAVAAWFFEQREAALQKKQKLAAAAAETEEKEARARAQAAPQPGEADAAE